MQIYIFIENKPFNLKFSRLLYKYYIIYINISKFYINPYVISKCIL